ncbi:MAG TPA: CopD family protein [Caulobacteraceae bacterium]
MVALLHGFYLAMLFSGFGTMLFLVSVARPALGLMSGLEREDAFRACLILARVSLLMSILLGIAWLGSETAVLAGANGPRQAIRALPLVILQTDFGHLLVTQIFLSAASLILAGRQTWRLGAATFCACIATLLEAWHLHAAAMSDRPLLICEVAHVLAAAVWLGSLLPLGLLLRVASPDVASLACRRYSRVGAVCVLALALTAFWQGWVLIGSPEALIATAYGWAALTKLTLFLALIGCAFRNRFNLTPALSAMSPQTARRDLRRSITVEASIGLVIVLVASLLASLPPGTDMMMR